MLSIKIIVKQSDPISSFSRAFSAKSFDIVSKNFERELKKSGSPKIDLLPINSLMIR